MEASSRGSSWRDSLRLSVLGRPPQEQQQKDFWLSDASCTKCYDCDQVFTLIVRRHHCRVCGRIFCSRCTTKFLPPTTAGGDPLRACNFCFQVRTSTAAQAAVGDGDAGKPSERTAPPSLQLPPQTLPSPSGPLTLRGAAAAAFATFRDPNAWLGVPPSPPTAVAPEEDDESMRPSREYERVRALATGPSDREEDDESDDDLQQERGLQALFARSSVEDSDPEAAGGAKTEGADDAPPAVVADDGPADLDSNALESHPLAADTPVEPATEEPLPQWLDDTFDEQPARPESPSPPLLFTPAAAVLDAPAAWVAPPAVIAEGAPALAACREALAAAAATHLRRLVGQALGAASVPHAAEWEPIVADLAQQAAAAIQPVAAHGMDPREYLCVKRCAAGMRSDSRLVHGVVCRRNVAHRRMASKVEAPRLLLLGGALQYARVEGRLSSLDTLLEQERAHLRVACARAAALNPNVMLVEKSCARYAQELLLGHGISLVLNVKPAVLRRLARATGAQVAPGADQLREQHVGSCASFTVHALDEELGPATPAGVLQRTLMIFEGCPRPLCATVLLAGAVPAELTRVKALLPWVVYAAYHLRLETALLADQLAAAGTQAGDAAAAVGTAVAAAAAALAAGLPPSLRGVPVSLSPHAAIPPIGAQPTAAWAAAAVRAEERLLVCLSCRSPSRRMLCEPHNMRLIEHYCATDVPLATFLTSALPGPGRRCSCGAGPEAHVRGYAAGAGQLTLHVSATSPPAEGLDASRSVWYWTCCRACAAEGAPPRGARVLLSKASLQLSLGRFLGLSLSASELRAPCGHALLQQALCFFGMAGGTACMAHAPLPRLNTVMPPRLLLPARGCTASWVLAELREISAAASADWTGFRNAVQASHAAFLDKSANTTVPREPPVILSELLGAVDADARAFSVRLDEAHTSALAGQPDIFAVSRLRRTLAAAHHKWDAVVAELGSSNWRSSFPVNARRGWPESAGAAVADAAEVALGSSPPCSSLPPSAAPSPAQSPSGHVRKGSDQVKSVPMGRALLPLGVGGVAVVVYDDEPTSIVAYALATAQYAAALSTATEAASRAAQACPAPTDPAALSALSAAGVPWEVVASSAMDSSHVRCGFEDREARGEAAGRFGVTAYYAPQFAALRSLWACGGGSFLRSLARCARWDAGGGGKSGAYFAKTRDDRFIIKGLSRPELQSLLEFAPSYAAYAAAAAAEGRPTLLAKLVGVYTVHVAVPGRRDTKLDVVIMENLFQAGVGPVYDLKGAAGRSRAAAGGSSVLLDENLADAHAAGDVPLAVSPAAGQALLGAVWRDTAFLARLGVMDYSLLAGAHPRTGHLAVGVVDFLRQYTWDKQLETYVKTSSAVLSLGTQPAEPTVVSPKQYARRFRKAMRANIVVVPDLPHLPEEASAAALPEPPELDGGATP